MKAFTVDEYKPCEKHFLIPESRYSEFENYCTKKDEKEVRKLGLKTIQKKFKGKDIREVEISATSYVGIFNIPDTENSTLIVRPKIGSTAFLQMLHYTNENDIIIQNIFAHGLEESSNFVQVFVHFLIKTIYDLLLSSMRKGYDSVKEDRSFVKGKVDYIKTIEHRIKSSNLIVCQYHRFNCNTLINKAIKYTLIQIRDVISSVSIRYFREVSKLLDSVDISNFGLKDFNRITYNRLTIKYKYIIEFCSLILKNQMVSLEKGQSSFPAFCFNSWNIFEVFIRKILRFYCSNNYVVKKQRYVTPNETVDPDIVLESKHSRKIDLVIDVKYKEVWNRNDYNEIHTFKTSIYAKKGMLIYPQDIKRKSKPEYAYEFFDFKEWMINKENYLRIFTEKIIDYINT